MSTNGDSVPVSRRECNLRHEEVDDMKTELRGQRKMLWGIVTLQLIVLSGIIAKLIGV